MYPDDENIVIPDEDELEEINDDLQEEPDKSATPPEKSKSKMAEFRAAYKASQAKNKEYEREQEERDKYYCALAEEAGYKDIKTEKEYRAAWDKQRRQQQEEIAKAEKAKLAETALGVDPEKAAAFVALLDSVRGVDNTTQPAQKAFPANDEITEFNKEFGQNLASFDDIVKLDNASAIIDRMEQGELLKDAFLYVNRDIVRKNDRAVTRQETINRLRGLTHVKQKQGTGEFDTTNLSDEEINDWAHTFGMTKTDAKKDLIGRVKTGTYVPEAQRTSRP